MPLKPGYSRKTLRENAAALIREGFPSRVAWGKAYEHARAAYREKFPRSAWYPDYLASPDEKRRRAEFRGKNPVPNLVTRYTVQYVDNFGGIERADFHTVKEARQFAETVHTLEIFDRLQKKAIYREPQKRSPFDSNPVPPSSRAGQKARVSSQVQAAAALYERFTGHDAEEIGTIDKPEIHDVMVAIGECDGILYSTVRDGKLERYIHEFKKKARPLFCVSPDGQALFLIGGDYNFTERGIMDN